MGFYDLVKLSTTVVLQLVLYYEFNYLLGLR